MPTSGTTTTSVSTIRCSSQTKSAVPTRANTTPIDILPSTELPPNHSVATTMPRPTHAAATCHRCTPRRRRTPVGAAPPRRLSVLFIGSGDGRADLLDHLLDRRQAVRRDVPDGRVEVVDVAVLPRRRPADQLVVEHLLRGLTRLADGGVTVEHQQDVGVLLGDVLEGDGVTVVGGGQPLVGGGEPQLV